MRRYLERLSPDMIFVLLVAAWWVVNLLQAAFTQLADDEAYYFMFAQNLAWGYYDHPPMTALMVWMGNFIGGELGVRFFFLLCQPLYLLILWLLARGKEATQQDAFLFFMIAAAIPMMMLYGFIAVPDVPLMLFSAVFLLCYKRFAERDSWLNTVLLGISLAALAYSKYHGALVVVLALVSNPQIFRRRKLYVAALLALVLFLPHLRWEQQHDWMSFRYHLSERNRSFEAVYPLEFLLNLFLVFNPLFFPLYVWAYRKTRSKGVVERALSFILIGFTGFFLLSSVRGHVQPQWVIPITFSLIVLLYNFVKDNARLHKYVMNSALITVGLVMLLRVEMIFNPIGLKFEIFNNKASYGAIAEVAQGNTVIFAGRYALAAKYNFYTGAPAYCQSSVGYRSSQWELRDDDTRAARRKVIIETSPENGDTTIMLANGRSFSYRTDPDFHPVRKVNIFVRDGLPKEVRRGEDYTYRLRLDNPYTYDLTIDRDSLPVVLVFRDIGRNLYTYVQPQIEGLLPSGGNSLWMNSFKVPEDLPEGEYTMGFAIRPPKGLDYWYNSEHRRVRVL